MAGLVIPVPDLASIRHFVTPAATNGWKLLRHRIPHVLLVVSTALVAAAAVTFLAGVVIVFGAGGDFELEQAFVVASSALWAAMAIAAGAIMRLLAFPDTLGDALREVRTRALRLLALAAPVAIPVIASGVTPLPDWVYSIVRLGVAPVATMLLLLVYARVMSSTQPTWGLRDTAGMLREQGMAPVVALLLGAFVLGGVLVWLLSLLLPLVVAVVPAVPLLTAYVFGLHTIMRPEGERGIERLRREAATSLPAAGGAEPLHVPGFELRGAFTEEPVVGDWLMLPTRCMVVCTAEWDGPAAASLHVADDAHRWLTIAGSHGAGTAELMAELGPGSFYVALYARGPAAGASYRVAAKPVPLVQPP